MSTANTTASGPRIVSIFRNIEAVRSPGTVQLSLTVVTSSAVIRVTRVRDRVVRWAGSARLASSGVSHLPDSCEANGYKWSFKALDMERLDRVARRPTVRLTHYGRHKSGKPHQALLGWW